MASPFDHERSLRPRAELPPADSAAANPPSSAAPPLLDAVLEQTLMRFRSFNALNSDELEALRLLVSRLGRQEFQVEPVGVELVKVLLGRSFETAVGSAAQWEKMAAQIAHALSEDPLAHDRLRGLWLRLSEGAS
jgi:hypothetical protein